MASGMRVIPLKCDDGQLRDVEDWLALRRYWGGQKDATKTVDIAPIANLGCGFHGAGVMAR
jgi:hypothetical protein